MTEENNVPKEGDIETGEEKKWYVFYVIAKHEVKVKTLLDRDGFDNYLPMITLLKQWKYRKKLVTEPLFKSYIFVNIHKNRIYDVLRNPSIVKNIRFEGEPAVIPQSQMDLIKVAVDNNSDMTISDERPKLGSLKLIESGVFEGQKGVVKEYRGKKKILVLLEAMSCTLLIDL